MKTVCLYFQVHQPWRLKIYRFFNIGKDHNYLDDFTNRAIMQKVAKFKPKRIFIKLVRPLLLFVLCKPGILILKCLKNGLVLLRKEML